MNGGFLNFKLRQGTLMSKLCLSVNISVLNFLCFHKWFLEFTTVFEVTVVHIELSAFSVFGISINVHIRA